jgi:predicted LPLAT superfamily acyltransferase
MSAAKPDADHQHNWRAVPERSNRFWISIIMWIALHLGRPIASLLLYPITTYFVIFSDRTRVDSRHFLRLALGRETGWGDVFRHYHTFAATLLDRIYIFAGQHQRISLSMDGLEVLERHARSGRGGLLVGAHLGSFEIIRAIGRSRGGFSIKPLVYGDRTPRITGLFQKLNPELFDDIVYMGQPGSLIGLDAQTRAGGFVAILGDRSVTGDKQVICDFFGRPAIFPQAPVMLARVLDVPMILFTCINQGNGHYHVSFEELADTPAMPRAQRAAATQAIMQRYAARIEHYCRLAPYNWFNFYDFWQSDP